jgi:hypothetical protein
VIFLFFNVGVDMLFNQANVSVESDGNGLVAAAFLHSRRIEGLRQEELDHRDPDYEVLGHGEGREARAVAT